MRGFARDPLEVEDEPQCIHCDEPTTRLDPVTRKPVCPACDANYMRAADKDESDRDTAWLRKEGVIR